MAEAVKAAAARQLPAFRLGTKKVFLPNHIVVLQRKEHQTPFEASFKVPLTFSKFDLRDYLFNLYNVEVKTVRSYVKQVPLAGTESQGRTRVFRPRSKKIMTVELLEPFQWPEVPENKEPWSNELWQMREESERAQEKFVETRRKEQIAMLSETKRSDSRKSLAALAKSYLSGSRKWTNDVVLDPKWDATLAKAAESGSKPRSYKSKAKVDETVAEKAAMEADAKKTE